MGVPESKRSGHGRDRSAGKSRNRLFGPNRHASQHGSKLQAPATNIFLLFLIGGIQTVTLGDEEARRRGTQKSVLERKAPPTFDVVVEIQNWNRVAVRARGYSLRNIR